MKTITEVNPEELAHFGVIGMKWGVRKGSSENTKVRQSRSNMYKNRRTLSDKELRTAVSRMQMEHKLKSLVQEDLTPGKVAAKDFLSKTGSTIIASAAGAAGAILVKSWLSSKGVG